MSPLWGREPGRKAHLTVEARSILQGTVRIGTRFETLCPVDVLLFFRDDAPQIEWLSTYDGSFAQDPDVLCLVCWRRAYRLVSGWDARGFSDDVRTGWRIHLTRKL